MRTAGRSSPPAVAKLNKQSRPARFACQPLADHRPQLQGPSVMNTFESNHDYIQVAALQYARLGFTPIPLRPNQKTSYHRGWPRLQPRTLLRQFEHHTGNIGMRI